MEAKENDKRKEGADKRAALGQWEGWKSDQQGENRGKDFRAVGSAWVFKIGTSDSSDRGVA